MGIYNVWKNRKQILEGLKNSVFEKEDVEVIAEERLKICRSNECGFHDPNGTSDKVVVKGKESCGNCGCNLHLKTRCLSCACPINKWEALLSEEEYQSLYEKLNKDK